MVRIARLPLISLSLCFTCSAFQSPDCTRSTAGYDAKKLPRRPLSRLPLNDESDPAARFRRHANHHRAFWTTALDANAASAAMRAFLRIHPPAAQLRLLRPGICRDASGDGSD